MRYRLVFRAIAKRKTIVTQSEYGNLVKTHYTNCLLAEEWGTKTKEYIEIAGIPASDILMANGVCSDDINAPTKPYNLGQGPNSIGEFLGPFSSGGLGGWPFVGIAGFDAFSQHATSTGTLFISNLQHIGMDKYGTAGRIYRRGQTTPSSDCGAIADAIKWVVENPETAPSPANNQLWYLTNLLWQKNHDAGPGLGWTDTINDMAYRMMHCTDLIELDARKYIIDNFTTSVTKNKPVFFFSGKMINVDDGYNAYVHIDYFGIYDSVNGGEWIDNTQNYISFCGL
jgi:hypothetical protein